MQAALAEDGLDGWLLYDFHGSNPIAARLAGLDGGGKMTTRRWFYLIPAVGRAARRWCTRSSGTTSTACPGARTVYAGREELDAGLTALLSGSGARRDGVFARTAPSPTSRASMRARSSRFARRGVEVVSSGDLVQRFEALLGRPAQLAHAP